jgi:hypothetical protein
MRAGWIPWLLTAAAVSLVAGSLRAQNNGAAGFTYGDLKEVTLQGKLVSFGDEMARKYGARTAGGAAEKQWGLALPEGQLYSFLDNDNFRKLTAGSPANQPVEVRARQFPRSMLLEVLSFKPVPAEAVKRRFYCRTCDIYTDDWGPCVCCGKEMQPVGAKQ